MGSSVYLVLIAIVVHSLFFVSIFDIYFTSPVEHGMIPQYYSLEPPAKRLVLFVADGLRADTLYSLDENGDSPAPFIRKIIEYHGRWGVSHTHVPTESRPGHVALIAGLYEDVSAVTRGWTENPVEFDSVFNRSRHTWSWGSPDILPMFAKGAVPGRVETWVYDSTWEDFADSDPSKLDTWVFEKVQELFQEALVNSSLAKMLSEDRIVFFLHLLGIDTNGHAHRPRSKEVLDNLRLVDKGVEMVTKLFESYFGDEKTAYVFTSDHGMTDWGSHGAGLPEETMTPLVCWGAGVRGPQPAHLSNRVYHDGYSERWQLERYERVDVEEADITPLMATLVGVGIPVNSEGVLPLGYIHYHRGFEAESIFSNVRQLMEQVRVKSERIESASLPLTFRPYPSLTLPETTARRHEIHELIKRKSYERAIDISKKLAMECKEAMRYFHTYHRFVLKGVLTAGFVGWMLCIVTAILEDHLHPEDRLRTLGAGSSRKTTSLSVALCLITWVLLLYQASPLLYCGYYAIPILCWAHVWGRRGVLWHALQQARHNPVQVFQGALLLFLGTCTMELMVFSFFWRELLSVLLVLLSLWPYFTALVGRQVLCVMWTTVCLLLAVFPVLPVVGRNANYLLVCLSGVLATALLLYILSRPKLSYGLLTPAVSHSWTSVLIRAQVCLLCVACFVPAITNWFFSSKQSIPVVINVFSWLVLLFCHLSPAFCLHSLPGRLFHIAVSLYTVFLLLCTTFESLFLLLFCVVLYLWLQAEETLAPSHSRVSSLWESVISFRVSQVVTLVPNEVHTRRQSSSLDDARQVAFCLFFGLLSFFGTGNIASVNTFDPATVYCFLTVFSPFVMGGLILWKMAIPFILVSCVYNAITLLLNRSMKTSILLMLIISDVMGLNFFFLVRDHGSWLEIGLSISHYIIMMTVIIGVIVLLGLAKLLSGVAVVPRKIEDHM